MFFALKAQHKTARTNMLWEGYYNTVTFNKDWSLLSDAQIRTRDWTRQWSQILVRSGLNYKINNHIAITGGFAFFKNAKYANKELFLKKEWRPGQEFSYRVKLHKRNFIRRIGTGVSATSYRQLENPRLFIYFPAAVPF